jgi:hypothetical protein
LEWWNNGKLEEWNREVRRQETGEKQQEAKGMIPGAFTVFQPIIPPFHYSIVPAFPPFTL